MASKSTGFTIVDYQRLSADIGTWILVEESVNMSDRIVRVSVLSEARSVYIPRKLGVSLDSCVATGLEALSSLVDSHQSEISSGKA
jgi:hypothetical protein